MILNPSLHHFHGLVVYLIIASATALSDTEKHMCWRRMPRLVRATAIAQHCHWRQTDTFQWMQITSLLDLLF